MDKSSLGGILVAVGGITAGLLLDGGNIGQIIQPTAALIGFGGAVGGILLPVLLALGVGAFLHLADTFVQGGRADNATATRPW